MSKTTRLGIVCSFAAFSFLSLSPIFSQEEQAADSRPVLVIPIKGMINSGLIHFIERGIEEAREADAGLVIFEINTFGGEVDAATKIDDLMVNMSIPTAAYVNRRAISAGALLALSTDRIFMARGGTIGAATPILIGIGSDQATPTTEKHVSYVRAEFRATAERKGKSVLLAEAMVDEDAELYWVETDTGVVLFGPEDLQENQDLYGESSIRKVSEKGKLLTLTSEEAFQYGLAEEIVDSVEEVAAICAPGYSVIIKQLPKWDERMVQFLTDPRVSGILLTLGLVALYTEFKVAGWGVPGTVGLMCLGLFFGSHYLIGLADAMEIILFLVGVGLIAAEIFVIPGFGFAGVGGICCLFTAIYLALVKNPIPISPFDWGLSLNALKIMSFSFVASIIIALLASYVLPRTPVWSRLALLTTESPQEGFVSQPPEFSELLGKRGVTVTQLRPSGRVEFEGKGVPVVTTGDFVDPGEMVEVVETEGNRVVVSRVESARPEEPGVPNA